jgi:hypothetical protein
VFFSLFTRERENFYGDPLFSILRRRSEGKLPPNPHIPPGGTGRASETGGIRANDGMSLKQKGRAEFRGMAPAMLPVCAWEAVP